MFPALCLCLAVLYNETMKHSFYMHDLKADGAVLEKSKMDLLFRSLRLSKQEEEEGNLQAEYDHMEDALSSAFSHCSSYNISYEVITSSRQQTSNIGDALNIFDRCRLVISFG